MTDWYIYNEIQKLKSMGFSKSRTAEKLQINFRTVKRYWDMTPADYADAFKDLHRNMRNSTASRYEQEILAWLEQHPDLSSAQIYDWLYEKYQTPPVVAERTMRRYIAWLREQHAIPRQSGLRSYEAVQELPPAEQAQVDMGSITLTRHDRARIKVFCFAMVLSHSRYKYAFWQDHPFTTAEFITAHQNAFAFSGAAQSRWSMTRTVSWLYQRIMGTSSTQKGSRLTRLLCILKFISARERIRNPRAKLRPL